MIETLVAPEISKQKLRRDFEKWKSNSRHQERGWLLLQYDEENLRLELAFLARLFLNTGNGALPGIVAAIRLTYENYDLWAPSLTFIDVFNGKPAKPHVRAYQSTDTGPRDVLIDSHPDTLLPFLCIPGIREYHVHPQHSGDSWLLYRDRGEGSVSAICDRIWRFMARNVLGLKIELQGLPVWPLQAQLNITIGQGDIDQLVKQQKGKPPEAPDVLSDKPGREELGPSPTDDAPVV